MSAAQPGRETEAAKPQDPFQRELLRQLSWLTSNLAELNNNVAIVADWIQMEREREARAKEKA